MKLRTWFGAASGKKRMSISPADVCSSAILSSYPVSSGTGGAVVTGWLTGVQAAMTKSAAAKKFFKRFLLVARNGSAGRKRFVPSCRHSMSCVATLRRNDGSAILARVSEGATYELG